MNNYNIKFLKKYKKPHGKVKLSGLGLKSSVRVINFDIFAIKSLEYGKVTANQIESARRAVRKITKKSGKILIRIYPYLPLMKKPAEVRMGKGKGSKIRAWVYPVRPGKTILELAGVSKTLAQSALLAAVEKLSLRCKIINLIDF
jgi:large subunit ribosomal protein L16